MDSVLNYSKYRANIKKNSKRYFVTGSDVAVTRPVLTTESIVCAYMRQSLTEIYLLFLMALNPIKTALPFSFGVH